MDKELTSDHQQHHQQAGGGSLPTPAAAQGAHAAIPAASLRLLQSLATSSRQAAAAPQQSRQQPHYHQQPASQSSWRQQPQQAQHAQHGAPYSHHPPRQQAARDVDERRPNNNQQRMGYYAQQADNSATQAPRAQHTNQAPAYPQHVQQRGDDMGGTRARPPPRQLYQPPRRMEPASQQPPPTGLITGAEPQQQAPARRSSHSHPAFPPRFADGSSRTAQGSAVSSQRRPQTGWTEHPVDQISARHLSNRHVHADALQAWPGSDWLSDIGWGVRVKGMRLANMLDGIMPGDVPHMFRMHSTSGQAEYWPLDMLACLCGCPNDSDCCSHKYAMAVARPQYRPKLALLIKAREVFDSAASSRGPLEPCIADLAQGLTTYLQRIGVTDVPAVCQVTAETVMALLLQQYIDDPSNRNRLWWRSSSSHDKIGVPLKTRATAQEAISALLKYSAKQGKRIASHTRQLAVELEAIKVQLQQQGKPVPADPPLLTQFMSDAVARGRGGRRQASSNSCGGVDATATHAGKDSSESESDEEVRAEKDSAASGQAPTMQAHPQRRRPRFDKQTPVLLLLFNMIRRVCSQLGVDNLAQFTADGSIQHAPTNHTVHHANTSPATYSTGIVDNTSGLGALARLQDDAADAASYSSAVLSDGLLTLMASSGELTQAVDTLLRSWSMLQVLQEHGQSMQTRLEQQPEDASGLASQEPGGVDMETNAAPVSGQQGAKGALAASDDGGARRMLLEAAAKVLQEHLPKASDGTQVPGIELLQAGVQHLLDRLSQWDALLQAAQDSPQQRSSSTQQHRSIGLLQLIRDAKAAGIGTDLSPDTVQRVNQLHQQLLQGICHMLADAGVTITKSKDDEHLDLHREDECDMKQHGASGVAKAAVMAFLVQAVQACSLAHGAAMDSASEAQLQQIEDAACRQFQVQTFLQLGCGELSRLLQSLRNAEPLVARSKGMLGTEHDVLYAEALLVGMPQSETFHMQHAQDCSQQALPLLSRLSDASIEGHGQTSIILSGASGSNVVVDTACASVASVSMAVRKCDGQMAVHSLLSLCAMHGGAANMPWQLLTSTLSDTWAAMCDASVDITPSHWAQYALDVALCMPYPFSACKQFLSLLLPSHLLASSLAIPAAATALQYPAATQAAHMTDGMSDNAVASLQTEQSSVAALVLRAVAGIRSAPLHQLASHKLVEVGRTLNLPLWIDSFQQLSLQHDDSKATAGAIQSDTVQQSHSVRVLSDHPPSEAAVSSAHGTAAAEAAAATAAAAAGTTHTQVSPVNDVVQQQGGKSSAPSAASRSMGMDAHHGRHLVTSTISTASDQHHAGVNTAAMRRHVPADVARAVIEDIRQKEFGIGMDASAEVQAVLAAQHARLKRALDRLSADLYAQKVHLLLELVQNVDDSTFDTSEGRECTPTMGLWVGPTGLAATSNEVGFTERDVRALCDVGNSAKAARKAAEVGGLTGEKGIGFKSVFTVSDRPHISSNGFTFGFNAQDPCGIGMVLPHWLGEGHTNEAGDASWHHPPSSWPQPPVLVDGGTWTTHIWLPAADRLLDSSNSSSSTASWHATAAELVAGVVPSLLLFLRRLQRIVLADDVSGVVHVLTRTVTDNCVEVTHCIHAAPAATPTSATRTVRGPLTSSHTYQWLLGKNSLRSPAISRRDIQLPSTDITVALPLPSNADATSSNDSTVDGSNSAGMSAAAAHVYAFLPVRSYGLPFALQADWLVPSSREDVLAGEAWNQLLREQVPAAFVEAVRLAASHPSLRYSWLSNLPQPAVVQGFFRPLASTIPTALKALPCIPTLEGNMAPPQHVLLADVDVMALVPEAALTSVLGLHFVQPQLLNNGADSSAAGNDGLYEASAASNCEQALLHLGAQRFAAAHLVKLLQSVGMEELVTQVAMLEKRPGSGSYSAQKPAEGDVATSWAQNCQTAWRLLALLEQLLAADSAAGSVNQGSSLRKPNLWASGGQQLVSRQLLQQLSGMPLLPAVGGHWVTPSPSLLLTPHFFELLQQLEEQEENTAEAQQAQQQTDVSPLAVTQEAAAAANSGKGSIDCVASVSWRGLEELHSLARGPASVAIVDVTGLLASKLPLHVCQSAARCLTSRLHVRPTTPTDIINHHVLPALQAHKQLADWQGEEASVVAYAAFLLKHQQLSLNSPEVAATWREALPLLLTAPSCYAAADTAASHITITQYTSHMCEVVPAHVGVILGLSFCNSTTDAASSLIHDGMNHTADTEVQDTGEAAPLNSSAQGTVMNRLTGVVGHSKHHRQHMSSAYRLPAALQHVLQHALKGVACCLHPAYLQHASADDWAHFFGDVLQCGFTCIRPQPPVGVIHADACMHASTQQQQSVQAAGRPSVLKAVQAVQAAQPRQEVSSVASLYSTDLACILAWFQQDRAMHHADQAVGFKTTLVNQALVEMWHVLDSCWQQELAPYCELLVSEAHRSVVLEPADALQQAHGQQIGELLQQCCCLPTSSFAAGKDLEQTAQFEFNSWQLVSPARGPWAARTARNLAMLGEAGSYVLPSLHTPELLQLLGVQSEPSVALLLRQLHQWQEHATLSATVAVELASHAGEGDTKPAMSVRVHRQPDILALISIYTFLWQQCSNEDVAAAGNTADSTAVDDPAKLHASSQHTTMYGFLASSLPSQHDRHNSAAKVRPAIRAAFHQYPLLAVPSSQQHHTVSVDPSKPLQPAATDLHHHAGKAKQDDTEARLSWIKLGSMDVEPHTAGVQERCLATGQVCWQDDSGVICGTVLPIPLTHVYPRSLHRFFTHVLGVRERPCEHDLLRCLHHARDTNNAVAAWTCLAHAALLLRRRHGMCVPCNIAAAGSQHSGTSLADAAVGVLAVPKARQHQSRVYQRPQPGGTSLNGKEQGDLTSCSLDWRDILSTVPFLPASQLISGAADSAEHMQPSHHAPHWVVAADAGVYMLQARVLGTHEERHTEACAPPVAITMDVLQQLQAAAHACGMPLHCIFPPSPAGIDKTASGPAGRHSQQAGDSRSVLQDRDMPAEMEVNSAHADLRWLLSDVLHLRSLHDFVDRQAATSQGVVTQPAALLHHLLPQHIQLSQQPTITAGMSHAVHGVVLRPDVAARLRSTIPLVLRYLAAKIPDFVERCLLPAGGLVSNGVHEQQAVQQLHSSSGMLGHALRNLVVASVPGLQTRYVMHEERIATQMRPCQAVLIWHQLNQNSIDERGMGDGVLSRQHAAIPLLLIRCTEDTQHPHGAHGAHLPPISLLTWQHLFRDFTSLFSDPMGMADDDLTSLLLMEHSLAGQPAQEVAQALQAMHPLPDLVARPNGSTMLAAAAQLWSVGSSWQHTPQQVTETSMTAARQLSERSETTEDEVVWQGRGSGGTSPTPDGNAEAGERMAAASDEQPSHSLEGEDHQARRLDPDGLIQDAPPGDSGMGEHDDRYNSHQAHGFEVQRALGGQPQYNGPMGSFVSEAVEVEPGIRAQLTDFAVAPDADADQRARRAVVGRLGEQLVFQTLQHKAAAGVEVTWVNEHDEAGLPYDVLITRADGSREFIEVKATSSTDKAYLEVSHREWLFAQQEGDRYHLYRVSGVGTDHPEIRRIVNPYMQWRSQRIGICLAI